MLKATPNVSSTFFHRPSGPYLTVRMVAAETEPLNRQAISHIAWMDILLQDTYAHWNIMQSRTCTMSLACAGRGLLPPCHPSGFAALLSDGMTPDVIVAHDLAQARLWYPSAAPTQPSIGFLRVCRAAWPALEKHDVSTLLDFVGITEEFNEIPRLPATPACLVEAMKMACLFEYLIKNPDLLLKKWPDQKKDQSLEAVLGDLSAPAALRSMLRISKVLSCPPGNAPDPWLTQPELAWDNLPLDDVLWYSDLSTATIDSKTAREELRRRVRGDTTLETAQTSQCVIVRRMPDDTGELGKLKGSV
jgi:hypothetical protein